jgi:hypothetical protein
LIPISTYSISNRSSVPNTYEKVAVLLMDAVAELRDLRLAANVTNPPNLAP